MSPAKPEVLDTVQNKKNSNKWDVNKKENNKDKPIVTRNNFELSTVKLHKEIKLEITSFQIHTFLLQKMFFLK